MKALDTNVLIRFLVGDDQQQAASARERFKTAEASGDQFYVSLLVALETLWVLESAYSISRKEIVNVFNDLLRMPILVFEARTILQAFVSTAASLSSKTDLADLLIGLAARFAGCDAVLTFDKQAAKSDLFELIALQ